MYISAEDEDGTKCFITDIEFYFTVAHDFDRGTISIVEMVAPVSARPQVADQLLEGLSTVVGSWKVTATVSGRDVGISGGPR